jgi:hypothetical protein
MNTVPSGRSDLFIKAAPAVSGTFWFGIPTPAIVGAPARLKTLVDPVAVAVFVVASAVAVVA